MLFENFSQFFIISAILIATVVIPNFLGLTISNIFSWLFLHICNQKQNWKSKREFKLFFFCIWNIFISSKSLLNYIDHYRRRISFSMTYLNTISTKFLNFKCLKEELMLRTLFVFSTIQNNLFMVFILDFLRNIYSIAENFHVNAVLELNPICCQVSPHNKKPLHVLIK